MGMHSYGASSGDRFTMLRGSGWRILGNMYRMPTEDWCIMVAIVCCNCRVVVSSVLLTEPDNCSHKAAGCG